MSLVPASFLFRFTIPVQSATNLPRSKAPLLALPDSHRVPFPSALEGEESFAELRLGWNKNGLAINVQVNGKKKLPICDPGKPTSSDGVSFWVDTRDTQTQHRASRYCHQFVALPLGGGSKGTDPVFQQLPVPRAREDAPLIDPDVFLLESDASKSGYQLSIWCPAEALHGFDPQSQNRLGFSLVVRDWELRIAFLCYSSYHRLSSCILCA